MAKILSNSLLKKAGIFQSEIAYHSMIVDFGKYQSFQLARTWVIYLHGFTEIRDRGGVGGQLNVTQFVRKRALGKPDAEALSAKIIAKLPWEGLGGLGGARVGELLKFRGLPCHVVHPTPNPTHQLAKIFTLTRHSSPQNIKMRWPFSPTSFLYISLLRNGTMFALG